MAELFYVGKSKTLETEISKINGFIEFLQLLAKKLSPGTGSFCFPSSKASSQKQLVLWTQETGHTDERT